MPETDNGSDLPEGWRDVVLGDLGKFSTSSVDKKVNTAELSVRLVNYMDVYRSPYLTSGLDYMHVTASRSEIAKSQLLTGDLLFTPSSETPDDIGHSAVVVEPLPETLHSYHTVRLRIATSEGIDLRFRGRFANSAKVLKHFEKCATGSTRYTLSLDDFRSAPVRLPPLAEQTKIAQVLDTLDTTIRQTEAIIEKLKQVRQGLLHDLLTRGIDASGELRPPQSQAPHLYSRTALGWIPRDWNCAALGELSSKIVDGVHQTPTYVAAGVPFVTVKNLTESHDITFADLNFVSQRDHREFFKRADPRPGDVLVTKDGTLGVARLVRDSHPEFSIFVSVAQIRPISSRLSPQLLLTFFESEHYRAQMGGLSGGSGLKHIHLEQFRRFLIPLPTLAEQSRIGEGMASIDARLLMEERGCQGLRQLKSGLVNDLLTGRVRVTPLLA